MLTASASLTRIPDPMIVWTSKGQRKTLTAANVIGQGGEGIVYEGKDELTGEKCAYKILYPNWRTPDRAAKLKALVNRKLHKALAQVYDVLSSDEHDDKICGIEMEYIDVSRYRTLFWYMKDDYRTGHKDIDFNRICQIFEHVRRALKSLHGTKHIVGDFNPNGILVIEPQYWDSTPEDKRVRIVDVDSIGFGEYPCRVYSLLWTDYQIAHDVGQRGQNSIFTESTDNFAFDAMFFEAATLANVYTGFHDYYDTPGLLMKNGLTVLHDDVEYPGHAVPIANLPVALQKRFTETFVEGKRTQFSSKLLAALISGKTHIVREEKTVMSTTLIALARDIAIQCENIVDVKIFDEYILILDRLDTKLFELKLFAPQLLNTYSIQLDVDNIVYAQIGDMDHVNFYANDNDNIRVYNRSTNSFKTVYGYRTRHSLVGGVFGEHEWSVDRNMLNSKSSQERYAVTRSLNFVVEYSDVFFFSSGAKSLTLNNLIGFHTGYMTLGNNSYSFNLKDLRPTEYVLTNGVSVLNDKNKFLVIRRTEFEGEQYTHISELYVDAKIGAVVTSQEFMLDRVLPFKTRGLVYKHGTIFYVSNQGVISDHIETGKRKIFNKTRKIVNENSGIELYAKGMLVYSKQNMSYIEI